jgi:hypothetical protein
MTSIASPKPRGHPRTVKPEAWGQDSESNPAFVVFVTITLLASMTVTQHASPEPGSLAYWMLIGPTLLLPLTAVGSLLRSAFGPAHWMLWMLAIAGLWHLQAGDPRTVLQLILLVWMLIWLASNAGRLNARWLTRIYLTMVVVGCCVYLLTDLNKWGPLPGQTVDEYGIWRVSFFPNIAYTAILSLAVVMVLTHNRALAVRHPVVLGIALYFVVFSFVRTALIALMLYAALRWWFQVRSSPRQMFWTALIVAIGINVAIASSVFFLLFLQEYPIVSRLLLRGETGLSSEELYQQLYRPWLWQQQWELFRTSPALMGLGTYEFIEISTDTLIEGHSDSDSVSMPTRLVVTYGLPGLLFMALLISRLRASANAHDDWACACFPAVFLLMMHWGSAFHPSDPIFAIFLLMVLRGRLGYRLQGPR